MDRKEQLRIFQSERLEVDASVNVDDYEDDVLSSHGELIGLVTGRKSPPGSMCVGEVCVFEIKDTSQIWVRNIDSNFEWVQAQVHSRGINSTVSLFGREVCLL